MRSGWYACKLDGGYEVLVLRKRALAPEKLDGHAGLVICGRGEPAGRRMLGIKNGLGWLSYKWTYTCDFRLGIMEFRTISGATTPPVTSMPSASEMTSKQQQQSVTSSLFRTPPWIPAPSAAASSGEMDWRGARPKYSVTSS